jgi:hypothetical protein
VGACQAAVTAHPHLVPLGAAAVVPSAGVTAVVTQPAVVPGEVPGCHSGASLLTVLQQRPLDLGSDLQRRWLLYQVLQVREAAGKWEEEEAREGGEGAETGNRTAGEWAIRHIPRHVCARMASGRKQQPHKYSHCSSW